MKMRTIMVLLAFVSASFSYLIYGSIYCDTDSTLANCGDVIVRYGSGADTVCITQNGYYMIYLPDIYDYAAIRVYCARKQGTSSWWTDTPIGFYFYGDIEHNIYVSTSTSDTPNNCWSCSYK